MKRFLLISFLFCTTLLPSSAQFFTERFREVPSEQIPSSRQGAAASGDYLFQFYDKGLGIEVFSMKNGKNIQRIQMPGGRKTWHCNNACVSGTYIYVSQEHADEHCICVIRITKEQKEQFSAELVQTIIFPAPVEMGVWYPNLALDAQNGFLYVTGFSRASWKDRSGGNGLQVLKFRLPAITPGQTVLTTADILSRRLYDFRIATQGAVIRDGRMYQVYGVPKLGACSIVCYNLETGAELWCRDLAAAGITEEPEALFFYGKELVCVDVKGVVYSATTWD